MKKFLACFFAMIIVCLTFSGCNANNEEADVITLNFINNERTKLVNRDYVLKSDSEDLGAQVEEILHELSLPSEDFSYISPMNQGFVADSFEVKEGKLVLDLSGEYMALETADEVLTRAALVKTLTQLDGINYILLKVEGTVLKDALGSPVGVLSSDSFIDNESSQINAMAETKLKLFFADETGTELVEVTRTLTYNTNISLEKLVVEQLIAGPVADVSGVNPTINPETRALNVTVKDGICYVNFNEAFLASPYNVTAEATIYSIVNSLTELSGVRKVQLSIEGDSGVTYKETISLSTPFERNLDIVQAKQ